MKHIFIVNPVAGKGKGMKYIEKVRPLLDEKLDYIIVETKGKGHATELANLYAAREECIIYAVGGDGTINEVMNGIVGTSSKLAIVPTGSGNDFIRGVYPKYKIERLLEGLIKGKASYVDIGRINEKYFLNVASVGLDAEIAKNVVYFKKLKFIGGSLAYLLSIAKTLLGYECNLIKIKLDGEEIWTDKSLLLAIANGKYYGGGIPIAPSAKVDDGQLNICLVKELGIVHILPIIPKLFLAKHEEAKDVQVFKATSIEVEGDKALNINIDGEIIKERNINIEIIPRGIEIIIPQI